jgi:hypothetical protein
VTPPLDTDPVDLVDLRHPPDPPAEATGWRWLALSIMQRARQPRGDRRT